MNGSPTIRCSAISSSRTIPWSTAAMPLYVTRKLTNLEVRNWYAGLVTNVVRDRRIREENIAPSTADWIQTPITFDTTRLTDSGTETAAQLGDTLTQWAPVAFVYLLWISIFSVTQMLLTNTVEEKSNKLVEVLLSSLRPVDLMAGKILGIAATGITIVGSWLVIFLAVVLWLPGLLGAPVSLDMTALVDQPIYLVSFFVYFLLGYLFYAALLCGIGSMANNLKEAQTLMMPVQLLLVVPLIVMVPIGRDPHGLLAQVLSWLPPFTPFVMMNRAAFPPSEFTYVGTTLLMLVSIYFALALAARVFETGVLMTGQPPKLRQLFQLLRGNRSRAAPVKGPVWIAASAQIYGDVRLADGVSVWFNSVCRAENEYIEVGRMQQSAGFRHGARRYAGDPR